MGSTKSNRIKYFDLLRIFSFATVIYCHMLMQLNLSGIWPASLTYPMMANDNMHIGMVVVGIFFMLSGASLMLSTNNKFEVKNFYKKRLFHLLIPFYVVEVLIFLYRTFIAHDIGLTFNSSVPAWRFIFTIFGMDEWVISLGLRTYTMGIGEWFLGCLVVLYILFPLFRFFMKKNRFAFMGVMTVIYVLLVIFYPFKTEVHLSIFFKGYEFIIGMFLMTFKKFDWKCLLVAIPVILAFIFCPFVIPVKKAFEITILCTSVFIAVSFIEPYLTRFSWKKVTLISNFTYPVYLVHHQVIYIMTPVLKPYVGSRKSIILMFALEMLVIIAIALFVDFASKKITKFVFREKKKKPSKPIENAE